MVTRHRAFVLAIVAIACALGSAPAWAAGTSAPIVTRFLEPDARPLVQYRAFRTMTASTRGGKMSATIEAWTTLDREHGFRFEVVSSRGSGLIRQRVLIAALEAEQKASISSDRDEAALTTGNYEFLDPTDAAPDLVRVGLRPWHKHVMRVDGAVYLERESADLRRIEGDLSRRPSFWTRRVRIRRDYARIAGVHVPVSMSSTADVLIVGASEFSMTYRYTEINGMRVE